jgi:hypothetical protein
MNAGYAAVHSGHERDRLDAATRGYTTFVQYCTGVLPSGFTTWLLAIVLLATPSFGHTTAQSSASRTESGIIQVDDSRSGDTRVTEPVDSVALLAAAATAPRADAFGPSPLLGSSLFQRPPPPTSRIAANHN